LFFRDGKPFTDVAGVAEERLQRAVAIRNRIAHSSEKCKKDFKITAQHFLGIKKEETLPARCGVGQLLIVMPGPHCGRDWWKNHENLFWAYMSFFLDCAELIAPIGGEPPTQVSESEEAAFASIVEINRATGER